MKVIDHINNAKETIFSFEILPPLKGQNIGEIYQTIDSLMEYNPPFVNVTYHREEVVYKQMPGGLLEQKVIKKRPGTVGICAAIQNKYKIDAVPHILCGGFNREDTENALIDLNFLGIENVLALRGDCIKGETYFKAEKDGHAFAADLVKQIYEMNEGVYLDEELQNRTPSNFCVGVAGYPEKHFEAPSLNNDIAHMKAKIDAGAEYITTQLFFDNEKYFKYVEKCRAAGITVPIIPGIKPIATKKHLSILPHFFHVDLPDDLVTAVEACNDNKEVRQVGIEWAINQCKELKKAGVPVLHFYSMGKVDNIQSIAREVF
ncbi:methylenetetrahydrofolate reductase [NAD(P)H] [Owenweeksia hongkongensis]|uniref:methylenetetrahydrofolate reductase [NAD(P)H] n=1 Tax=Owenweeksia hongkongensis TaxID=253245 RepID=UPI003A8D10E2